jgi:integrase/recombinase XerD
MLGHDAIPERIVMHASPSRLPAALCADEVVHFQEAIPSLSTIAPVLEGANRFRRNG